MLRFSLSIQSHQTIDRIESIRRSYDERVALWRDRRFDNNGNYREPVFWCDESLPCISPADALQQSLLYTHTQYGVWLLKNFGEECLQTSSCCCPVLHSAVIFNNEVLAQEIVNTGNRMLRRAPRISNHSDDIVYCVECRQEQFINQPGCEVVAHYKTALHLACETQTFSLPMIKLLMREGACPHCIDYYGITPIDIIISNIINPFLSADEKNSYIRALILIFTYLTPKQILYYRGIYAGSSMLTDRLFKMSLMKSTALTVQCRRVFLQSLDSDSGKGRVLDEFVEQGKMSYPVYRFLNYFT